MNRATYPVKCAWCGAMLEKRSVVPNSTGICGTCRAGWQMEQAAGMRNASPPWQDEAAEDRRRLIDAAWRRPSSFMDGFLIGGAVAILLGILAEWLWHR